MGESQRLPLAIRKAGPGDNSLLASLGAETFSDAFGAANTPDDMRLYLEKSFSPEVQAAELADPSGVFLLAENGGVPAGYARLRESVPSTALAAARPIEIVRLYARTPWIGRGVGAALMQACLEEGRARGCDTVWLDVWERNARAIEFYQRWGFVRFGVQPFRLGNDLQTDILMARPVTLAEGV
jgi:GNAT superfamily N-acetyltransferase